jgi:uncharacterized membrane protein (DUF485 family)
MKKAIFVVLEALLFLVVYFTASLLAAVEKLPKWTAQASSGRLFVFDGLIFMGVVCLLVLLVQAARKRLRTDWITPALALVLSLLYLLATHFPMSWIGSPGV